MMQNLLSSTIGRHRRQRRRCAASGDSGETSKNIVSGGSTGGSGGASVPMVAAVVVVLMVCMLQPVAAGLDCNACGYTTSVLRPDRAAKKLACQTAASLFSTLKTPIQATCDNWPGRMSNMNVVDEALSFIGKIDPEVRKRFEGVRIRWCDALGKWADGMVLAPNSISLHRRLQSVPVDELASVLLHELYHVQQYRNWGEAGFDCRYATHMASHGTGRGNHVEQPAYDWQDRADRVFAAMRRHSPRTVWKLAAGDELKARDMLVSHNKEWSLVMQRDGNLALQATGGVPIATTGTTHNGDVETWGSYLVMQHDGNLVLYNGRGVPRWNSGTNGRPQTVLVMSNKGELQLHHADKTVTTFVARHGTFHKL